MPVAFFYLFMDGRSAYCRGKGYTSCVGCAGCMLYTIIIEMEKHVVVMSRLGQTNEPEMFSLDFIFLASLKKIERHFKVLELEDFSC